MSRYNRQSKIVSEPVSTMDLQAEGEKPKESSVNTITQPVIEPERVTFYGGGTHLPIVAGKRRAFRFLPENGHKVSVSDPDEIKWLREKGFEEKAKK